MKTVAVLFLLYLFSSFVQAETYQWSKGYTGNCDDTISRVGYDPNDPDTAHLLLDPANIPGDVVDFVTYYVLDNPDGDTSNPLVEVTMLGGCTPTHINTKVLTPGVTYYKSAMTTLEDTTFSAVSTPGKPFDVQKANPNSPGNTR